MTAELYIGLMSGTSLDGVDGVLVDLADDRIAVRGHAAAAFPAELRSELLALNTAGDNELHRAALAGNALVRLYASVVDQLLTAAGMRADAVTAIGAHGQTVRHRPGEFDGIGYTLQLNQAGLLAELCGIDVVADFRSRDVAAGGQGAPLVPAFHHAAFGLPDSASCVLNIGGIANLSVLPPGGSDVIGFDCGPGNVLLDAWCLRHTGLPYDAEGRWAAGGRVLPALLAGCLAEPYFDRSPPKSTGRDLFHRDWLAQRLDASGVGAPAPADVQATLAQLTAETCARAVSRHGLGAATHHQHGGALNTDLMQRIRTLLPGVAVVSSNERGLPPLEVEATAFAWLARRLLRGEPGNLPKVTGARGARLLGAVYRA
ncbi:MAG: anhydro-N-acetylmuramic acid kinase [Comamonadaceae bacterium]|nr:MAG: anhydro-N-acetylmuramic acid kinase [Comamonadaceae bacterium]